LEENFDRINIRIHKEKEMVDSRRWFLALAVPLLFAGLASAQVGGSGTTPLTCNVNTSNTPTLRSEGITEQVGDIVITCSGGPVLPNGTAVSQVNITVSLSTQVTSRLIGTVGASEGLLLIDEPNSGLYAPVPGFGPAQPFDPCPTPTSGGCTATVLSQQGSPSPGAPLTPYQTAVVSSDDAPVPAPNVYQGVVAGNQITFFGVPVLPPGTNGNRVFRITNVRINASGIGGGSAAGSLPVQASILTSNPSALPITNPTPIVGFVEKSLTTSSTTGSFAQCVPQNLSQAGVLTFTELFAGAFKTRVDPTVSTQTNGQGNALVQNVPGTIYEGESGFTLSVNGGTAGLADYGTRFTAVFNNLATPGAHIYVSQYGVTTSNGVVTGQVSSGPSYAQEITSESTADGDETIPAGTPSGVAANGVSVVEITPSSGTSATATWEVITAEPTQIVNFQFAVYISYTPSPGTDSPPTGTSTVNLRYGPASTVTTAATGPLPRFLDTSTAANGITIAICQTVLLFPFVTNQAGFDTGLALANTSTDPFGTTPQSGTCSLNWYGAAAPSTPTVTPTIATATDYTLLASVTVPGFQGYMISVCNFQYAHGFAFISDVGATKLAMGYLALIIPQPTLNFGRNANNAATSAFDSGEQLAQ
jgi:large repetitive protein